jgi:hypothetical protein
MKTLNVWSGGIVKMLVDRPYYGPWGGGSRIGDLGRMNCYTEDLKLTLIVRKSGPGEFVFSKIEDIQKDKWEEARLYESNRSFEISDEDMSRIESALQEP